MNISQYIALNTRFRAAITYPLH